MEVGSQCCAEADTRACADCLVALVGVLALITGSRRFPGIYFSLLP